MFRTTKEMREFYNCPASGRYESFQKSEGWNIPALLIENILPLLRGGERMIDVGCGPGLVGEELEKSGWQGLLIGLDVAENRLHEARRHSVYGACVHADAYHLPFRNCCFDIVLSSAMVGLTGIRSIREMRRIVGPGGYLACVIAELKDIPVCRERFEKALLFLKKMSDAELIICKDLGSGYSFSNYGGEHFVLFVHRIVL
ncbi:MAG: methyltransferase domain-containing protein [Candidatus Portnoybacteria bacterium]|nr:methyltransferase domain-containing protein [Candidatus Portnoybacteria bacterium]